MISKEHIIVGVHKTIRGVKEQLEATRKELEVGSSANHAKEKRTTLPQC